MNVTVRQDQGSLNTLSKATYGSGLGYQNADIRVMFTDTWFNGSSAASQKSYDTLKSLNLGMVRFPSGDPSFWYRWDKPCGSVAAPQEQCAEYLSPDDVTRYFTAGATSTGRAPLGGQTMFQINTIHSWIEADGKTIWKTVCQKSEWQDPATGQWLSSPIKDVNGRYLIDEAGLQQAAAVAANWVRANRKLPTSQQAVYWEIGNEDWVRWTPEQYARIVAVVGAKMIEVNGKSVLANGTNTPLRLIAQTTTLAKDYTQLSSSSGDANNLAINQTAGVTFATRFAGQLQSNGLAPQKVYGVAVHPYLTGDRSPSIDTRTLTMFSKIDAANSEVQQSIDALTTINKQLSTSWKALVTEYNVLEGLETDTSGRTIPAQNKAHALILADWTARMLSQGIEKVLPHNIEADTRMGLFLYRNGYPISEPRLMAPSSAFARLSTFLQGSLYRVDNNAPLVSYSNMAGATTSVRGLSNYAAVSADGLTLNVLLVNRNLYQSQNVTLTFTGAKKFKTGGTLYSSSFGEANRLVDDNFTSNVTWTTPRSSGYTQTCTLFSSPRTCTLKPSTPVTVPAGSIVHLQVPLQ